MFVIGRGVENDGLVVYLLFLDFGMIFFFFIGVLGKWRILRSYCIVEYNMFRFFLYRYIKLVF